MLPDPTSTDVRPHTLPRATAWLAIGSLITVVVLGFGTYQAVGVLAHEERIERDTIDANGIGVLDIDSDDGSIEVIGTDGDDIVLTARVSDGLQPTRYHHEVIGDRLEVRVRCPGPSSPWCQVRLRVEVPRELQVTVHAQNGGVSLRGLDGRAAASSENGSVDADGLGGPAQLISENGSVRATGLRSSAVVARSENGSVSLTHTEAPRTVAATSENGTVEVAIPSGDEAYVVDIGSGDGSTTNGIRTDPASDRSITARSENGTVNVRYLR